jgi:hypothetical protein
MKKEFAKNSFFVIQLKTKKEFAKNSFFCISPYIENIGYRFNQKSTLKSFFTPKNPTPPVTVE